MILILAPFCCVLLFMVSRLKYRFLFFVIYAVIVVFPQQLAAQGLPEAVVLALENHPSIEGAKSGYKAAEQTKNAEQSNFYPELSVSATGGRVYQDNATSRGLNVTRGAAYSGFGEGNISMRQMLFDGYETLSRVGSAEAQMKSLGFSLSDTQEMIALRVAQSYVDVIRVQKAIELIRNQAVMMKDYEDRILTMVEEGAADETELQQARDVLMIIDGISADYEGQLGNAEARFYEAVGQSFLSDFLEPETLQSYIQDDVAEVVELAKNEHPALRAAHLDAKASQYEIGAEKAQLFPDLSGELSYLKSDKRDVIGGENVDARAVVRMNWGFSVGGRQFAQIRQKQFTHHQAKANYRTLEREIERDIRQSYVNYTTLLRKMALASERVELNTNLLNAYKVQFEGARVSLLNLMRSENQLFNALLEENDNYYNLLSAEYMILAATGKLKNILLGLDDQSQTLLFAEDKKDY